MKASLIRRDRHRLSHRGYANILRVIQARPRQAADVAEEIETSPRTTLQILRRMADIGLAHEVEWTQSKKGPWIATFAFGGGPRAPYPGVKRLHVVNKWNRRPDLMAFANLVKGMQEGPATRLELIEQCGLNPGTVLRLLKHCKAIRLARIADWDTSKPGPPIAMWGIGRDTDAPRPAPMTHTEIHRRYMQARRAREQILQFIPSLVARPAQHA